MALDARLTAAFAELVDGGPGVRFTIEHRGVAREAFAIRHGGVVHAYLNCCAHQEIELDWIPGAFFAAGGKHLLCALHGALYEADSGRCVAGPCAGARLSKINLDDAGLVAMPPRL
jgi:nitrite reductase/ring-hydroxylating ferredoxin subunit